MRLEFENVGGSSQMRSYWPSAVGQPAQAVGLDEAVRARPAACGSGLAAAGVARPALSSRDALNPLASRLRRAHSRYVAERSTVVDAGEPPARAFTVIVPVYAKRLRKRRPPASVRTSRRVRRWSMNRPVSR